METPVHHAPVFRTVRFAVQLLHALNASTDIFSAAEIVWRAAQTVPLALRLVFVLTVSLGMALLINYAFI